MSLKRHPNVNRCLDVSWDRIFVNVFLAVNTAIEGLGGALTLRGGPREAKMDFERELTIGNTASSYVYEPYVNMHILGNN